VTYRGGFGRKTRMAVRTAGIKESTNQRCNRGQCLLAVRFCEIAKLHIFVAQQHFDYTQGTR
jgi:hypothetical protein